ncbi:hypothetical protein SDC9_103474 [bioreactor metagenome]|uniref:Uncharacterized protein n=1 Tax=bioreactor metagenome TaxID=1076179 RepID=A0A645ATT9_9ZZZZ
MYCVAIQNNDLLLVLHNLATFKLFFIDILLNRALLRGQSGRLQPSAIRRMPLVITCKNLFSASQVNFTSKDKNHVLVFCS